jgi:hypothetical protein
MAPGIVEFSDPDVVSGSIQSDPETLCESPAYWDKDNRYITRLNEPFWARFYACHEKSLIFETNEEQFYTYDEQTGLFLPQSVDSIRKNLAELIFQCSRIWADRGYGSLEKFRSERVLHGIIAHLRGEVEQSDFFNRRGDWQRALHLGNGVLVFGVDGSHAIQPFSQEFRSRNRSPINFERDAKCPNFVDRFLGHLEPDDRELIQKYGGQCLLGRNLTQRILILEGVANASKGAFVQTTRGVVGPSNCYELRTEHLAERFEIGRMTGKTLLLGADVRADFLSTKGAGRLKALVGGDTLEAERKGSNKQYSLDGVFNVIVTANSRLRVRLEGDRGAWERRISIVRYDRPYEGKKVPDIHRFLLETEAAGILNFYIEGAQKLIREVNELGDIVLSDRQKERVATLLSESDSLRLFLSEKIARTSRQGDNLTVNEIVEAYSSYCISAGWTPIPVGLAQRHMEDLMLELFSTAKVNNIEREGKAQRGFRNVRLCASDD